MMSRDSSKHHYHYNRNLPTILQFFSKLKFSTIFLYLLIAFVKRRHRNTPSFLVIIQIFHQTLLNFLKDLVLDKEKQRDKLVRFMPAIHYAQTTTKKGAEM